MAVADTTTPQLSSLTFPATVKAYGITSLAFTADAFDAGTGVDHVTITLDRARFASGGGNTITIGGSRALFQEGSQSQSVYFDQSSSSGTYHITDVAVVDRAGNVADYSPNQLAALGISTSFTVESLTAEDTTPPVLTSLTLPANVDVTGGTQTFALGATASDTGLGVYSVGLTFDHGLYAQMLTQGSNGLTGYQTVLSNAASGAYHLLGASVTDKAGNVQSYTSEQLAAMNLQTSFTVTSNVPADNSAPVLTALSLPTTIDVTYGAVPVPISAMVTDAGTGVAAIAITLDHGIKLAFSEYFPSHSNVPQGGPIVSSSLAAEVGGPFLSWPYVSLQQVGGTNQFVFGSGESGLPVSASAAAGTYHVTDVTVIDKAGNSNHYDAAQLAQLGANTTIQVVADQTAPVLTGFTLTPMLTRGSAITATASATDTGTTVASVLVHNSADFFTGGFNNGYDASHLLLTGFSGGASGTATGVVGSAPNGRYQISDIIVFDGAGNSTLYTAAQLSAAGYSTGYTIVASPVADLDGNGLSDVLWRNVNGALSSWSGNVNVGRQTLIQDTSDAFAATSWHAVETFDWNGDHAADMLWRNDDGAIAVWTGSRYGFTQSAYLGSNVAASWHIAAAGDLDGDGRGDILWRNDDGSLSTWLGQATGFRENAYFHESIDAAWKVQGLGDFNGDGKADILWRNANGAVSVWNGTGNGFQEGSLTTAPVDQSWHVVGIGDFNGDGRDDVLWRNDNGELTVWQGRSDGTAFDQIRFNAAAATDWHVAAVGDFNGDGRADLLWRNDAGAISIWNSTGSGWTQNSYFDASVGHDWSIVGHVFA